MKKIISFLLSAMLLVSCMTIVSAENTVSLSEATRFEFEDYTNTHVSTVEPNASGTGVVGNTYASVYADISIPVTVSESGYYDVSYVVSDATTNLSWLSTVEFYLGDTLLGDNANGFTENLSNTYPNLWTASAVGKVEQTAVYLEIGTYDLTAVIHNTAGEANQGKTIYKYMFDYIEFAPTESFVRLEFGNMESVITYDSAVSGVSLLALYNDNELVCVKQEILKNKWQASYSIPVDVKVTHAKAFLWKDLETVTPLSAESLHEIRRALYTVQPEEIFTIDSDIVAEGDMTTSVTNSPDSPCRQFPFLWQFGDTVIASWSQHTDTYETAPYDAIMVSRDGGKTWGEKQVKQNFYLTSICQLEDETLFGVNYWTHYVDKRTATVHYWTSDDLGASWTEHEGTIHHETDTSANSGGWASIVFHRGMRQLPNGTLQGLGYGHYVGDKTYRCVVIESADGGKNWYVTGTVASDAPLDENGTEISGVEGFCEPVMAECADGSLLCMMRIGSNKPLYQSRSYDGGATWTTPEMLPGIKTLSESYSVDPDLCLMDNGVLVLTTGRPNAKMLVSLDGSGYLWQENSTPLYTGSTGYTGVRQVGKDRLLVIGDMGSAWQGVAAGATYGIWGRFVNVERRTSYAPYLEKAHLSYDRKVMNLNETQNLKFSAFDNDGRKLTEGLSVSFQSSDEKIALVTNSGVVTAVSGGNVTITATVSCGEKTVTSNEITVQVADLNKLESVLVGNENDTVAIGKTKQITAKAINIYGTELSDDSIVTTYETSSENIATVDANGVVTGVSAGTAVITVTMTQGETVKSAKMTIAVFGGVGTTYTFEDDAVGSAPAGVGYHPNAASVSVSDAKAASGTKSVCLNDTANNSMTCIRFSDTTASATRVVDFKLYPESISTGVCLKLYRDNNFDQKSYSYNLTFSANGTVKCYHNNAWSEMLPADTVKIGDWNTVRVATNLSDKSVTVTVNGETATMSGVSFAVGNTYGVEFHSGSTYTPGCKFYLDDVTISRNLNLLTNGGFEAGTEGWSGNAANLFVSTDEMCTGSAAVKVEKTGIYGYIGQKVSVVPGATYKATAWTKLGEGNDQNVFLATAHKADGKDVYTTIKNLSVIPGEWTELSGTITIPEGVTELELYVQLFASDNSTGALTQDFYVDDVLFEKVK